MSRHRNWWPLGAAIAVAAVVLWLLYLLYRTPPDRRDDLSTYGAFVWAVVAAVCGWIGLAWRKSQQPDTPSISRLDHAADVLAESVRKQWQRAAVKRGLDGTLIPVTWSRPSQAMAVPADAAVSSTRFGPLPGLPPVEVKDLAVGQASDLHAVYGGLRSGRLIIAGPPGSGKTGAAVQLVLEALRYRKDLLDQKESRVPVPILITAQAWDPEHQPVEDWLARKLRDTYPMFATANGLETATELITTGRITLILDGLDEISENLRAVALRALNQQVTFRLVLLSRSGEIGKAAASQGVLDGAAAVELNAVDPSAGVRYLQQKQLATPSPGWRELAARIRGNPDSPLAQVLSSPLALTLVRDTYQAEDSIRNLLEFCDTLAGKPADQAVRAITDHLLDRVLPTAYADRPGEHLPYDLDTARGALARIAAQMKSADTHDLNWWQVPTRLPGPAHTARAVVCGLPVALPSGLIYGMVSRMPAAGFGFGLFLMGGTLIAAMSAKPRPRGGPAQVATVQSALATGFVIIFAIQFLMTTVTGTGTKFGFGFVLGPVLALVLTPVLLAAVWLVDKTTADPGATSSLSPAASWHKNRRFGIMSWVVCGPVVGLAIGLATPESRSAIVVGCAAGYVYGQVVGLGIGFAETRARTDRGLTPATSYVTLLASIQLALKFRTPMRLMAFLEDAYERDILRAVGPAYQFRHGRLQDRLAELANIGDRVGSPSGSRETNQEEGPHTGTRTRST